jgi:mRNA deadenylase 3'-5' endonuclease subunit Ccr4
MGKKQKQQQKQKQQIEEYPLHERNFITLTKNAPTTVPDNSNNLNKYQTINVMTYNILAQCLIHRELYPYCKEKNTLKLSYRSKLFMKEFESLQPDIATFQEVDNFNEIYIKFFINLGYDYKYIKKQIKEKVYQHGICILWKKEKFSEIQYNGFLFDESPLVTPTEITPITGNTGQVLALKFNVNEEDIKKKFSNIENEKLRNLKIEQYKLENEMGIIISNHHLYWKPNAKYEKLRQIYVLLNNIYSLKNKIEIEKSINYNSVCEEINKIESAVERKHLNKWPVLMCGDFNTTPDQALYKLITEHKLTESECQDLEPIIENDVKVTSDLLSTTYLIEKIKEFPIGKSSYGSYRDNDPNHTINPNWNNKIEYFKGEPTYTTYCTWKGTLDYVFLMDDNKFKYNDKNISENFKDISFQPTYLTVRKNLNIPNSNLLEPGLPNLSYPSDHIGLMNEIDIFH